MRKRANHRPVKFKPEMRLRTLRAHSSSSRFYRIPPRDADKFNLHSRPRRADHKLPSIAVDRLAFFPFFLSLHVLSSSLPLFLFLFSPLFSRYPLFLFPPVSLCTNNARRRVLSMAIDRHAHRSSSFPPLLSGRLHSTELSPADRITLIDSIAPRSLCLSASSRHRSIEKKARVVSINQSVFFFSMSFLPFEHSSCLVSASNSAKRYRPTSRVYILQPINAVNLVKATRTEAVCRSEHGDRFFFLLVNVARLLPQGSPKSRVSFVKALAGYRLFTREREIRSKTSPKGIDARE